jgi:hypothetical protein
MLAIAVCIVYFVIIAYAVLIVFAIVASVFVVSVETLAHLLRPLRRNAFWIFMATYVALFAWCAIALR